MNLVEKSKQLAKSYFRKLKGFYKNWYYIHSKYVGIAALDINPKLDKETMLICGWLHDIGKVKIDEGHPKISAGIAERFLKNKVSEDKLKVILDCIANHSSSSHPATTAGKVFQNADKLAIFYPEVRRYLKKSKVPEEEIKKIMTDHLNKIKSPKIKRKAEGMMMK